MTELPSGTVTFLFTDIEGSTALLKQLGDRYAEVLDDQRRLLRQAFAAQGGREIDTQGDSFFFCVRAGKKRDCFGDRRAAVTRGRTSSQNASATSSTTPSGARSSTRCGCAEPS